jgi:hypothetical protein
MSTKMKSRMAATVLMFTGLLIGSAQGDFALYDNEEITVDTYYGYGELWENSKAEIVYGGSMDQLIAMDNSKVFMFGGYVNELDTAGSSIANIMNGELNLLGAWEFSTVTFDGRYFNLSGNLYFDGNRILGTDGTLTFLPFGGMYMSVNIYQNDPTATILTVPEPATLLLFGLVAAMVIKRR